MKNRIMAVIAIMSMCGMYTQLHAKSLKSISHEHNSTEANYKNKKNKINSNKNKNKKFQNGKLTCESINNRRVHCPINTRNGIRLIKELSRRKCQGNWGYDYYGVWVVNSCRARFTTDRYQNHWGNNFNKADIIRCESFRSGKISCPIKRNHKKVNVTLVHQLSAKSCKNNWGHNNRDIWVNKGCKADFRVEEINQRPQTHTGHHTGRQSDHQSQRNNELTCSSKKYRKKYCDVARVKDVEIIEVLSKAKRNCNSNNWGYDNRGIWVDNNCKARFRYKQLTRQSDSRRDNDRHRHNNGNDSDRRNDTTRTVKCKSQSKSPKVCVKNVRKAELVREISKGKYPCHNNWGIDRYGDLFVKNKCSAEFKVWDK